MAKKNDKPATKKPAKGMFLSDVAMKEISEVLKHYEPAQKIELIEHLQQMFKEVADYFKTKDDAIYGRYGERQEGLLKKYGRVFKPFANKRFDNYFDFNRLLSIKDYYSAEEYNHLASNDDLSQQDIDKLAFAMRNFLDGELHFLYLDRDPAFETVPTAPDGDEPDKDMTEARQLLAIHYLLKAGFSVEARGSNNVSEVARLAHLLLGKKIYEPAKLKHL